MPQLCQRTLIRVKIRSRDILVEGRLRSHYLIVATMGRVNHIRHEFATKSRPAQSGFEREPETA